MSDTIERGAGGAPEAPPGPAGPMGAPGSAKESRTSFGEQVRALRAGRRLTAATLARRCGVSRSLVSQIETGRISPSLDVVRRLAAALDVPIAALFGPRDGPPGDAAPGARPAVVRRDERKGLRLPRSRITYELLSPNLRGRLQVQWVELAPGEQAPEEGFVHRGEECYVVLEGRVRFRVAGEEYVLNAGDALTFDSSLPHGASNDGPGTAVALAAMTPPSF